MYIYAVHILKNELSPTCRAHFRAHQRKTNVFGAPPQPGAPASDATPSPARHAHF